MCSYLLTQQVVQVKTKRVYALLEYFCEYFYLAFDVSTIQVRETTEYSVDIELVDKAHNLFVSFVKCNGTQTYTTENRVVVDREKSLVKESFPDGNDRVWISNLIPNCNYKCVVVQKNYMDHRGLSLVKFSTKYAGQYVQCNNCDRVTMNDTQTRYLRQLQKLLQKQAITNLL